MSTAISTADLANRINAEHKACTRAAVDALTHAMNAGELLIQVKEQCGHGNWSKWLADNFSGSDTTARAYMRCAKHREEIELKRQSTADLTLEHALKAITPREHKPEPPKSPDLQLLVRERAEEQLAEAVLKFDELANVADGFGESHEEVYRQHYATCAEPGGDLPAFHEYKQQVEEWRSAEWFDDAVDRVQTDKINRAERENVLEMIHDAERERHRANQCFHDWMKECRERLSRGPVPGDELEQLRIEAVFWGFKFAISSQWRNGIGPKRPRTIGAWVDAVSVEGAA